MVVLLAVVFSLLATSASTLAPAVLGRVEGAKPVVQQHDASNRRDARRAGVDPTYDEPAERGNGGLGTGSDEFFLEEIKLPSGRLQFAYKFLFRDGRCGPERHPFSFLHRA